MSKVINLNEWRKQKSTESEFAPIPGFIIWLHCPKCKSTEYTEVRMTGGRIHKCGTIVEEAEVAIDVRAEFTIVQRNLEILKGPDPFNQGKKFKLVNKLLGNTEQLVQKIKNNEIEYQRRLQIISAEKITPYPQEWIPEENGIEYIIVQPNGIMITTARQADQHFPKKQ
ncbi:MAG: hypothetical protein HQM13_07020 [SAR324 cluster bacterium]|nr:hypothetical protein [SAR324 cluster bacterium]